MTTTRQRGNLGEDFVCDRLRETGYEILERNWRSGRYEIDIIARQAEVIAFVEVKLRAQNALVSPAMAVRYSQRKRIVLAAVAYLKAQHIYNTGVVQPRFDVYEVVTARAGSHEVVRHFHMKNAFQVGDLHVFV